MVSPGVMRPCFLVRNGLIATLRIVLVLTLCPPRAVHADYNGREKELCTFGASIDLTSAKPNATGLLAESGHFFPREATRLGDGVRYGCICDIEPCLLRCPLVDETETATTYVPEGYVNYSAIPRAYATDLTIDDGEEAPSYDRRFHVLVRDPCPDREKYFLDPFSDENDEFYLLRNGTLYLPLVANPINRFLNSNEYCLELLENETSYTPYVCSLEDYEEDEFGMVKYVGAVIAVPFLLATVIVYSVIPRLRNIHGTTLRYYLCCLTVSYVALGAQQIPEQDYSAGALCLCLGFTVYFAFFASFLWLNVMCFDMWWMFSGLTFFRNSILRKDSRKIVGYSIYAWGIPAVLTAICIAMEFAPGVEESVFHPGFRKMGCWFRTKKVEALYFYGPVGFTVVCNVCLFVATSVQILRHNRESQRDLHNGESGRHNENKQWFGLYLKLFVVMGIAWMTEIISWLWERPKYLWYVTDMINALQGILIFVIFVCKRNIWRSLKKRFVKKKLRVAAGREMFGPSGVLRVSSTNDRETSFSDSNDGSSRVTRLESI